MQVDKLGGSVHSGGKLDEALVIDTGTHALLQSILVELKLMNIKLTEMSDFDVKEIDLPGTRY